MCYFFFILFFSYQHQIISNILGSMCTNERHNKKTFETELKNEGFNDLTSTKKECLSESIFIFTERYTIYKFHLFLALCLNVSRTEPLIQPMF